MPLFGPPNIEKLKQKRDIEGLAKALSTTHPEATVFLVIDAAAALAELGEERGFTELARWFERRNKEAAEHAAKRLTSLDDERAVDPLLRALKYDDASVQIQATRGLRRMHDSRIPGALLACLVESHRDGASVEVGEEAVVALVALRPIDQLLAALPAHSKGPTEMRVAAARVLSGLPEPDAQVIDTLIAAINDRERSVREYAAEGLGRTRERRAIGPLAAALEDGRVGRIAAEALAEIARDFPDDPQMTTVLVGALPAGGEKVATQLKRLADSNALEAVADLLGHEERGIRLATYEALWLRGVDRYGGPLYVDGIQRLGAERDPWPVAPILRARLADADDEIRARAVRAVGLFSPLFDELPRASEDRSAAVRLAAIESLIDMGTLNVKQWHGWDFGSIREAIEAMRDDEDRIVSAATTEALHALEELEREYWERWGDYTW